MRATTFFRSALLLPFLLPMLALPLKWEAMSALLLLSLGFGGVQYVFFSIFAFFWVGQLKSPSKQAKLLWLSPLVFLPFQIVGWFIYFEIERLSNPNLTGAFSALLPIVFFSLLIGYIYAVVVYIAFLLVQKFKPFIY